MYAALEIARLPGNEGAGSRCGWKYLRKEERNEDRGWSCARVPPSLPFFLFFFPLFVRVSKGRVKWNMLMVLATWKRCDDEMQMLLVQRKETRVESLIYRKTCFVTCLCIYVHSCFIRFSTSVKNLFDCENWWLWKKRWFNLRCVKLIGRVRCSFFVERREIDCFNWYFY